ncbi:GNAT family N-acetyltransferase/peptidase C39 family protein [Marinobacterium arenosum]|uniref:GNAT family N-acetyltransferase/peptidase C39 family protein n=1 Tax=Marinobacterium arenosum TaxID=2862496 RepID=UPI001C96B07D|nr:GNAT family N-acetyltransferase/peptidase C39 family protein [Marinobacterium arenosum]MBY4677472.1 GNAT family N-acetyltransferase/peptidase C39 family protein [Marinobacterium arenosum]
MSPLSYRPAQSSDVDRLVALENLCFDNDRLSRRSFQRLVKQQHSLILLAEQDQQNEREKRVLGYILILYRSNTSLARLYSLAVDPQARGLGIAAELIHRAEQFAEQHGCAFMRLEVAVDNQPAISLYHRLGYHQIQQLPGYYENDSDGLRMEKSIRQRHRRPVHTRLYMQTTPFTCGPASLLMALHHLDPGRPMTRREELQIWRESTTIFMTAGHGGCSPQGLALSAWRRNLQVEVYLNQTDVPFLDSVRDPEKKAVIELVHEDLSDQLRETDVKMHYQDLAIDQLRDLLQQGAVLICLISTWRLNRNKAPHWVLVTAADERFIYLTDPELEHDPWLTETDYLDVPIEFDEFARMAAFGRRRLRCSLVLRPRDGISANKQ